MIKQKSVLFAILLASLLGVSGLISMLGMEPAVAKTEGHSAPFSDQRQAVRSAVYWLINNHQNRDGGYSSFSTGADLSPSSVGGTVDAIMAIAAAGYNPAASFPGKTHSPISYLQNHMTQTATYAAFDGAGGWQSCFGSGRCQPEPERFWRT